MIFITIYLHKIFLYDTTCCLCCMLCMIKAMHTPHTQTEHMFLNMNIIKQVSFALNIHYMYDGACL